MLIPFSLGPSAVLFYYPNEGVWSKAPHSPTPRGLPTVPPSQRFEMQIPFTLAPLKQCVHVHAFIFWRFSNLAILLGHFPAFDLG